MTIIDYYRLPNPVEAKGIISSWRQTDIVLFDVATGHTLRGV